MTLARDCYLALSPGFASPPRSTRSTSKATSSSPVATPVPKTSKKTFRSVWRSRSLSVPEDANDPRFVDRLNNNDPLN